MQLLGRKEDVVLQVSDASEAKKHAREAARKEIRVNGPGGMEQERMRKKKKRQKQQV